MSQVEDMEAIRALHSRYALSIDEKRHEDWVGCFTDDGVFSSPRFGTHEGQDALRKFCVDYDAALDGAQPRHVITNISVEISGDTAEGSCYLLYYHSHDGKNELSALGGYRDRFRKVDGQWLFERREIFLD